ncbi:reverse transcriptase-like protein, partial [Streptomyces sp. NPDC059786]|uniref:reverse transcriptase-like protein n=1 Tax=Streptomyces sp. NPDC059786 TaxID=3346946 RepID=UPI0036616AEB
MRELTVEADGGSRGNPGPAGYGAVVIDTATGETLAETAEYIGVATNNVAEYRGLLAGLRAARELDPDASVRVRMDSKLVVEQMSGRWQIKHPGMKPLAAEAARIFPPARVTYEWIPRERNKHADRLANEAMDAGRRGEQWSPDRSTADLDTAAERSAAEAPSPPGDAAAGAAKARAALAALAAPTAGARGTPADARVTPADASVTSVGERAVSDACVTSGSDARAASVGERAVSDAPVTSVSDARAASVGERAVSDASVTSGSDARAASVGERAVSDASVTSGSDARAASVGERAVSDASV